MSSLADIGERIGLPAERLEELLQLPIVGRAMTVAAEHPDMTAHGVWKAVGRPTLYKGDKLDVESLLVELAKRLDVMTRNEDGKIIEQRSGHPMIMGRLKLAEQQADRRLTTIYEVAELMRNHYAEPASMLRVKQLLGDEIARAQHGGSVP